MKGLSNPKNYQVKLSTNLKVLPDLKKKLLELVEESGNRLTMSDVVNEALANYFKEIEVKK